MSAGARTRGEKLLIGAVGLVIVLAAGALVWQIPSVQMAVFSRLTRGQLARVTTLDPANWRAQYWYGYRLVQKGELPTAARALQVAMEADYLPAYREMGRVLLATRDVETAFQLLKMVVGRDPEDLDAQVALGTLYHLEGSDHRAMEVLEPAVKAHPNHIPALYALAAAHEGVQQFQAAEELLRRALRQQPENPDVLVALGRVRRARGDLNEAETLVRSALARRKSDAAALLQLAQVLALKPPAAQNQPAALEALRSAAQLKPKDGAIQLELGRLELDMGQAEAAARRLESLLQRDLLRTEAYYLLARAYQRLGRKDESRKTEALFHRKQAYDREVQNLGSKLGADPDNLELRYQLGELHAREGNLHLAIRSYQHALQRDPSNQSAQQRLAELLRRSQTPDASRGAPR